MPVYTTSRTTRSRRKQADSSLPIPAAGAVDAVAVIRFAGNDITVDRAAKSRQHRPDADLAVVHATLAARPNDRARCYAVIFSGDEVWTVTIRRHSKALGSLLETMRAHDQVELVGEAKRLRGLGLLS